MLCVIDDETQRVVLAVKITVDMVLQNVVADRFCCADLKLVYCAFCELLT